MPEIEDITHVEFDELLEDDLDKLDVVESHIDGQDTLKKLLGVFSPDLSLCGQYAKYIGDSTPMMGGLGICVLHLEMGSCQGSFPLSL